MKKFNHIQQIKLSQIRENIQKTDISEFSNKILLCMALYKNDEGLKPSFVKIDFFEKNARLPEEIEYDYEELYLLRKHVLFDEFLDILQQIENKEEIQINSKNLKIGLQNINFSYVFSDQNFGFTKSEFPMIHFYANFTTETDGFLPNTPLIGINCPPFPNSDKAISYLFNVVIYQHHSVDRRLMINIPTFKARIKSVQIFDNKTTIQLEAKNIPIEQLQIQYYITGKDYTILNPPNRIQTASFTINTKSLPIIVLVVLTDSLGEVIDKKEINTEFMYGDSNVEVVIPDYKLKKQILNGENKNLEFKSKLNEPERFVRSVVAFANTIGGRIILGVDDKNGKLVSVYDHNIAKETILNHISEYCDPKIDVSFQYSKELKVLVVDIPEGDNKPYFLKDEGIFLRFGATNRHASRSEQEQINKNAQELSSGDLA